MRFEVEVVAIVQVDGFEPDIVATARTILVEYPSKVYIVAYPFDSNAWMRTLGMHPVWSHTLALIARLTGSGAPHVRINVCFTCIANPL
jgi:hypothetical protein